MRHRCVFNSDCGFVSCGPALKCACGRWSMPEEGRWLRVPQLDEFDANLAVVIAIIIAAFLLFA